MLDFKLNSRPFTERFPWPCYYAFDTARAAAIKHTKRTKKGERDKDREGGRKEREKKQTENDQE